MWPSASADKRKKRFSFSLSLSLFPLFPTKILCHQHNSILFAIWFEERKTFSSKAICLSEVDIHWWILFDTAIPSVEQAETATRMQKRMEINSVKSIRKESWPLTEESAARNLLASRLSFVVAVRSAVRQFTCELGQPPGEWAGVFQVQHIFVSIQKK